MTKEKMKPGEIKKLIKPREVVSSYQLYRRVESAGRKLGIVDAVEEFNAAAQRGEIKRLVEDNGTRVIHPGRIGTLLGMKPVEINDTKVSYKRAVPITRSSKPRSRISGKKED